MPARIAAPRSFARRLTAAFLLVAGASAAVLAVGAYLMVRQARLDDSVRQGADDARYQLVLAAQFQPLDDARTASMLASFEDSGRHVVLVTDAGTAASNDAFAPLPGARLRVAAAAGQLAFERPVHAPPHLLVVGGRIPGSTDELYLVRTEDRIYTDLGQLRTALTAGWVVVVVLAASVGRLLARRTLEPVGRASRAARAVAEGLLATRLPVPGRDEFGAWAQAFNDMAAALEANFAALTEARARERRFTADVAHELRTPVTALVAEASLLGEHLDELPPDLRRAAELLVADIVRLRRLVEELMEISRLDAGGEAVVAGPVDLAALLRSIVGARGWVDRVRVDGATPAGLRTDPRRLERVLANLLSNAVEHGGGPVQVAVRSDGATVTVTVSDQGPGIPAGHLPHIFDRFYKADPARSRGGSGLGLAIARENALLLGAGLRVRSEPGAGTEFRLDLPVAPPLRDGEGPDAAAGEAGPGAPAGEGGPDAPAGGAGRREGVSP